MPVPREAAGLGVILVGCSFHPAAGRRVKLRPVTLLYKMDVGQWSFMAAWSAVLFGFQRAFQATRSIPTHKRINGYHILTAFPGSRALPELPAQIYSEAIFF